METEAQFEEEEENYISCRAFCQFARAHSKETFLSFLLLIDVLIVIGNVAIDSEFPDCDAALRVCGLKKNSECVDTSHRIKMISTVFSWVSIAILIVFSLDVMQSIRSKGLFSYFRVPAHFIDALIVVVSLVVELTEIKHHHDTGLLVLARSWRFVMLGSELNDFYKETRLRRMQSQEVVEYRPL